MIYFASDLHLGLNYQGIGHKQREKHFVKWLEFIEPTCDELFLVGDIFDFWFEFKKVVPKGFVRLFAKLAQMTENGIKVNFFGGNHDMWTQTNYFRDEIGLTVYNKPTQFNLQGKRVLIAHGDGLTNNDTAGKLLTKLFKSPITINLFRKILHPDFAIGLGQDWSNSSRHSRSDVKHEFRGKDEPLVIWAQNQKQSDPMINYFVFGHLHTPAEVEIDDAKVFVLGEWITNPTPTYAVMNDGVITLQKFNTIAE